MSVPQQTRGIGAQILGLLVFLAGIATLAGMLWLGYELYRAPNLGMPTGTDTPGATGKASASPPLAAFVLLALRIGLLVLGSVLGGLIARKGIRLYGTARGLSM